jgi:hypothetical protein
MSFDWNNFLLLAEELADRDDVASKRTAISRAYYFMLNLALARAKARGGWPLAESTHNWCWQQYQAGPDSVCQRLGLAGQRIKAKRVRADYENADFANLPQEVQRVLLEARKFRQDLAGLDPRYPLVK